MDDLKPHQQRVVAERDELAERLGKLNTFIGSPAFNAVEGEERRLLLAQAVHMTSYFVTLIERIDLWKTQANSQPIVQA